MSIAWSMATGLTACAHDLPPEVTVESTDSTPVIGPPIRLTLNPGADMAATFTTDGTELLYSWESLDRRGQPFCLGRIPLSGGTRRQEFCPSIARPDPDSTDWFLWPAPHPDGHQVVWFHLWTYRGSALSFPYLGAFERADLRGSGGGISSLHIIPFQVAVGPHFHPQPERIAWANDSTVLYLAVLTDVLFGRNFPQDTLRSGVEIGRMTIGAAGVTLGYLPGTVEASGLDVHADGTVYFTRKGEAGVYRTHLSDPTVDTVFDASAVDSIVRDAVVRDTVAYVILKGSVVHTFITDIGFIQADGGGELWRLTPSGATLIDATRFWRRPVLSPDGHDLIVEGKLFPSDKPDLYRIRID